MTTYSGKSCSFGFLRVPFANCCQFMYLVISLLVLRAGCGIWLYQFLIIVYLFILNKYTLFYQHFVLAFMSCSKANLNKYTIFYQHFVLTVLSCSKDNLIKYTLFYQHFVLTFLSCSKANLNKYTILYQHFVLALPSGLAVKPTWTSTH